MRKIFRYLLLVLAGSFLAYHSVYFKKLSEVRAQEESQTDFTALADSLYYHGILNLDDHRSLCELLDEVQADPENAFQQYGNRLGIGNSAYFFIETTGTISGLANGQIAIQTSYPAQIKIDTKYIFGNALRDASGLVRLTDFKTTKEFNQLSEQLNALVRERILPQVYRHLTIGDSITVQGAVRLSKKEPKPARITIIPAKISQQ